MVYSIKEFEEYLLTLKNEENSEIIESYLNRFSILDKKTFEEKIKKLGNTKEEIEANIEEVLKQKLQRRFTPVNSLISYGTTDDSLHIHLIPESITYMLNKEARKRANIEVIDALMQIREKIKLDDRFSNIKEVEGISPILKSKKIREIFTQLGFESEDEQRKELIDKFKGAKEVIRVSIAREKLCSDEWLKLAKKLKEDLEDVDRDGLD